MIRMADMLFGYCDEPDSSEFDYLVEKKIDELVKQGLDAVGTNEETVLFSRFVNEEISEEYLRYRLYEDAKELVCDEIIDRDFDYEF